MRRLIFWRYILIGAGWVVALGSMDLPGAKLNGFLLWHGYVNTRGLVQFLFGLPRRIIKDWNDPTIHNGIRPNGFPVPNTFAYQDLAWLAAVLIGFLMFIFAVIVVRKEKNWSSGARVAVRCFAPLLLVFPVTMFAPPIWGFPLPKIGMYLLGLGHVLVFSGVVMGRISAEPGHRFPVLPRAL